MSFLFLECFSLRLLFWGFVIPLSDGTCTFPSYLVGEWTSAERGSLSITSDSIYNYKVYIPSSDPNNPSIDYYNFTCLTKVNGNRFTIRSVNFNVLFGTNVFFYICLDIYSVSDQLNYYYHATAVDNLIRENMVGIAEDKSNSYENICTRSYIDPANFIVLLRKDAVEDNAIQTLCPDALQMVYSNVTFTGHSGSTDNCGVAQMDGCTNTTMLNFTQGGCTEKTLSDGGIYTCIYSKTVDSQLYFAAWNNDDTLSSSTYRFSCFKVNNYRNGTVFLEEKPNFCGNSVNFTAYPSTSSSAELKEITDTCQLPTMTEAPFVADLNYLFILLGLFIIFMVVVIMMLTKRLKIYIKKKKDEKPLDVRKGEKVGLQRFDPKKSLVLKSPRPVNYFRPKRAIQIVPLFKPGFSTDEFPIHPPPKVTCIYTDSIVDYMRGRMPRRPDGISLYSFDSAIFRARSPFSTISIISTDDDDISFGSASC